MALSPLELKKLKVEYKKVNAAREELEMRIIEFQENIARLEDHIKIQKAKEDELTEKINENDQQ
jgi:predicted  nucleic acid-binding Zn-ribbon protein